MTNEYKSVICSWGYNKSDIYLDCYMEINSILDANYIKMIELRTRMNGGDGNYGLFRIPVEWNREEVEQVIKACTEQQLQNAHKAILASTYTLKYTDKKKYMDHIDELPLLMGLYPWLDAKIKEALS